MGRLRKKLFPRRIDGELFFSTSDPAVTGILLGGAGMLLPVYGNRLRVRYSFEEVNCCRFEGRGVGSFLPMSILAEILRTLLNREVRRLWKAWKEEE